MLNGTLVSVPWFYDTAKRIARVGPASITSASYSPDEDPGQSEASRASTTAYR